MDHREALALEFYGEHYGLKVIDAAYEYQSALRQIFLQYVGVRNESGGTPVRKMIYDVNSPLFKQFLSEKLMRKTAAQKDKSGAGAAKGQTAGKDRAMAHPASVGC
eukprot:Skav235580  [mRNA]  locus=scaffold612:164609:166650:- [translate_table: standard]